MNVPTRDEIETLAAERTVKAGALADAVLVADARRALEASDPRAALCALLALVALGRSLPPLAVVVEVLPALPDWECFVLGALTIAGPLRASVLAGLLYKGELRPALRPAALALLALHAERHALAPLATVLNVALAEAADPIERALLEIAGRRPTTTDSARRAAVRTYLARGIALGPLACLPRTRDLAPPTVP